MTDTRPDTIKCPGCSKSRKAPVKAISSSCRSCGTVVAFQDGIWNAEAKTASSVTPAKPTRKTKNSKQPVDSHTLAIEGQTKFQKCPHCDCRMARPKAAWIQYNTCKKCHRGLENIAGYFDKPEQLKKHRATVQLQCEKCRDSTECAKHVDSVRCRFCRAILSNRKSPENSSSVELNKPKRTAPNRAKENHKPGNSHALAIEGHTRHQKCPCCAETIVRPRNKFKLYDRCKLCLHGLEQKDGFLEKPSRLAKEKNTVKLSCVSCQEDSLCEKDVAVVRCRFCNAILQNRKMQAKRKAVSLAESAFGQTSSAASVRRSAAKKPAGQKKENLLSRAFSLIGPGSNNSQELGFFGFLGYLGGIVAGIFLAIYFEGTSLANLLAPFGWAAYIALAIATLIAFAVLIALVLRWQRAAEYLVSNSIILLIAALIAFDIPNPNRDLVRTYAEIARAAIDAKDHSKAAEAFGQAAAAAGADGDLDQLDDMLDAQFYQRRKTEKK